MPSVHNTCLFHVGERCLKFIWSMLMNLKNVFLDKEHKMLIVKGLTDESIPYDDIKEILRPWTTPYIARGLKNED